MCSREEKPFRIPDRILNYFSSWLTISYKNFTTWYSEHLTLDSNWETNIANRIIPLILCVLLVLGKSVNTIEELYLCCPAIVVWAISGEPDLCQPNDSGCVARCWSVPLLPSFFSSSRTLFYPILSSYTVVSYLVFMSFYHLRPYCFSRLRSLLLLVF